MSILKRFGGALTLAGLMLSTAGCTPAHETLTKNAYWNLPTGVTSLSREAYSLHMMMFWICVVIGVLVFGVMFYSMFAHRRSRHPTAAGFMENSKLEIAWTIVPFLILVATAIPAAATLIKAYNTNGSYMTVVITGAQWRWVYEYPDFGVGFISSIDAKSNAAAQVGSDISPYSVPHYLRNVDHDMVVPVNKKIRLFITSADVDHGWAVLDLGVRKNAYPGFINEAWFKADRIGTYRGQCSVLCGRGHGFMPIVVKVVSLADFNAWAAAQKKAGHTLRINHLKNAGLGDTVNEARATPPPASAASAAAPASSASAH